MNETLTTNDDGRSVLRMERRLAHPPAKVWRALTEPQEFSQWFPVAATGADLRVGGSITLDLGTDPNLPEGITSELTITELDPPHRLEFNWDGEILRWELEPTGTGCLLRFIHTFDDRAGAASFASGWQECFNALDNVVSGVPIQAGQPSAELHDRFVELFGLDQGSTEQTADGWQVRFERQLTAPAQKVWAVLADDAPAAGGPVPASFTVEAVTPGPVGTADAPRVLEYPWLADGEPAGTVRWELADERGTGHGARLILTQTGPADRPEAQADALTGWRDRLRDLAARLR